MNEKGEEEEEEEEEEKVKQVEEKDETHNYNVIFYTNATEYAIQPSGSWT